jgi:hypothetical protein
MSTVTHRDPSRDITRDSRPVTNRLFIGHATAHAPSRRVLLTRPYKERGAREVSEVTP